MNYSNNNNINYSFYRECYGNIKYDSKTMLQSVEHFYKLYPLFSLEVYKSNSPDLKDFSNNRLMWHYHHYGKNETRKWSKVDNSLNESGKEIKMNHNLYHFNKSISLYNFNPNYLNSNNISSIINFNSINIQSENKTKINNISNNISISNHNVINNNIKSKIINININNTNNNINKCNKYVVIGEWGYPPYGGGECWMIDTIKWMNKRGFETYYIYYTNPLSNNAYNKNENDFELFEYEGIKFIHLNSRSNELLYYLIKYINPRVVAHQGLNRIAIMTMCNLLNISFIT